MVHIVIEVVEFPLFVNRHSVALICSPKLVAPLATLFRSKQQKIVADQLNIDDVCQNMLRLKQKMIPTQSLHYPTDTNKGPMTFQMKKKTSALNQ